MVSTFSDNLTLLRLDRRLTRPNMVDILNVPKYTYRNWEYGIFEPNIENLIKLSNLFKISIDELVGNKELSKANILDKEKFYKNKEKLEKQKLEKEKKTTD